MKNKQTFNNGIIKIYSVKDIAQNGDMPKDGLKLKETLRFHRRAVGIKRYYTAMQANQQVDAVLRCPFRDTVSAQDVVIWNRKQYRVALVQYPEDVVPLVMDLTLTKVEQDYELADG